MASLEAAKKRRAGAKGWITRTRKTLTDLLEAVPKDVDQIEGTLELLNERTKALEVAQSAVECLLEDVRAIEADQEDESAFLTDIHAVQCQARKVLKAERDARQVSASGVSTPVVGTGAQNVSGFGGKDVSLIKLSLPVFDGDPLRFQEFMDAFAVAVDKSQHLSKCQKMTYLKGYLRGEAQRSIEGWDCTDDNYDAALEHLKKRFGDPEIRKEALCGRLLEMPEVPEENTKAMRALLDLTASTTRSLNALGVDADSFGFMLKLMLMRKVPESYRREFQRAYKKPEERTFENLVDFLNEEVAINERCQQSETSQLPSKGTRRDADQSRTERKTSKEPLRPLSPGFQPKMRTVGIIGLDPGSGSNCVFCEGTHELAKCPLTPEQRLERVKACNRCFCCLKKGHPSRVCFSKMRCSVCGGKHHTQLHIVKEKMTGAPQSERPSGEGTAKTQSGATSSCGVEVKMVKAARMSSGVFLKVAVVEVVCENRRARVRCLLDDGSSGTFVSEELASKMMLPVESTSVIEIFPFRSTQAQRVKSNVVELCLRRTDQSLLHLRANTVDCMGLIQEKLPKNADWLKDMQDRGIEPADAFSDDRSVPDEIHIVIGSDWLLQVETGERVLLPCGLGAIETSVGWVLQGKMNSYPLSSAKMVGFIKYRDSDDLDLNSKVSAFWEIENIPSEVSAADDFLDHFSHSVKFDGSRYVVPLLWKGDMRPTFNGVQAQAFFEKQKVKLMQRNMWDDYREVIEEYREFGAVEVDPDIEKKGYFLPHHAVIRPCSDTHRMRIVFNGSASVKGGVSLNDCLDVGPNLLPHVASVLLGFRKNEVGVAADLKKAFFTVGVAENDRDFLRLKWDSPLRLCRVPFGLNCSPFLLQGTILMHLKRLYETGDISLDLLNKLRCVLYMDDLVDSLKSLDEADCFRREVDRLFLSAGMELHKWKSNVWEIDSEDKCTSVLGVKWSLNCDTLQIELPKVVSGDCDTKRKFLSLLSSMYDPLGLYSAVLVTGKILLQSLWKDVKAGWDDLLPKEIVHKINEWKCQVLKLSNISFPRSVNLRPDSQLHIFVDASEKAYAAVSYVVSSSCSCLLYAKTKVAPLKSVSLPRLELQAALCGVRMAKFIMSVPSLKFKSVTFWTDSSVVLGWLRAPSYVWCTFVANRVAEIQSMSDVSQWRHVGSADNPADLGSRGMKEVHELNSDLWMHGPQWLLFESDWPIAREFEVDLERRKNVVIVETVSVVEDPFIRISDWNKLIGVITYMLRWKDKTDGRDIDRSNDLKRAESAVFRLIQKQCFESIWMKYDENNRNHPLWKLNPFLDTDGVLRVRGRLQHADVPYDAKYPVLLHKDHRYTMLLIAKVHRELLHGGVESMLSRLRQQFWILKGRRACRSVKSSCVVCRKYGVHMPNVSEVNPPLPEDRVVLGRPFTCIGLDYIGPFLVKVNGTEASKVWILEFVCAATRAIHMEVVSSLSVSDCEIAFRKFVARRGLPNLIRSDNAVTFKKLSLILKKVTWFFNAPHAPWWGGFFERLVQLVKRPLRKVLGGALVSRDEFDCLVCQIEGVINERPLSVVSSDVEDLPPITPSSLMGNVFDRSVTVSELSIEQLTKRQLLIKRLSVQLQRRWKDEYLSSLQQRDKRFVSRNNISVGDLAWLENGKSRADWPLVRVVELSPGKDGKVRSVKVRGSSGIFWRPIQRLLPVEMKCENILPLNAVLDKNVVRNGPVDRPSESVVLPERGMVLGTSRSVVRPETQSVAEVQKGKTTRRGRIVNIPKRYQD